MHRLFCHLMILSSLVLPCAESIRISLSWREASVVIPSSSSSSPVRLSPAPTSNLPIQAQRTEGTRLVKTLFLKKEIHFPHHLHIPAEKPSSSAAIGEEEQEEAENGGGGGGERRRAHNRLLLVTLFCVNEECIVAGNFLFAKRGR